MEEKPIGKDALNLDFEALSLLEALRHEGTVFRIFGSATGSIFTLISMRVPCTFHTESPILLHLEWFNMDFKY